MTIGFSPETDDTLATPVVYWVIRCGEIDDNGQVIKVGQGYKCGQLLAQDWRPEGDDDLAFTPSTTDVM